MSAKRMEHAEGMPHPQMTRLDEGTYVWCTCGLTNSPPMCDGSHVETGDEPLEFEIDEAHEVELCNCGLTATPPFCDGSHVRY